MLHRFQDTGESLARLNLEPNHDGESFRKKAGAAIPSRRLLFAIVLIVVVVGIAIGVRYLPDLNWIVDRENSLRNHIALAPVLSWFVGLLIYVGLTLIPGTAGKSIVFGWLFGFVAALILVEIGLTAAAILSFLIGRFVVKQLIDRRWQIRLRMISQRFSQDGAFYLLWLRLAHTPLTLVNYGAGATNIPLVTFWWTTHLGILPSAAVFTFIGSRIPSIRAVIEQGAWAIVDPPLLIVLAVTTFLPALVSPWIRKIGRRLTK